MTRTFLIRAHVVAALGVVVAAAAAAPRAMTPEQGTPAALAAIGQGNQASKPTSPVDDVTTHTRRYFEAVGRNDVTVLERLLAPDYVEVSPLGQVDRRAQVIGFYRTAAQAQTGQASELTAVAVDELSVRVYGDVAVAIAGESFTMNVAGTPVARPMRSTLVWHKVGGAWKLVSSHHTTVRPPIAPGSPVDR
jgi:ketosteroid isomerase-like protein